MCTYLNLIQTILYWAYLPVSMCTDWMLDYRTFVSGLNILILPLNAAGILKSSFALIPQSKRGSG